MNETIKRLKELREKATQGEYANWDRYRLMALDESYGGGCTLVGDGMKDGDVNYLAALHNSLPELLAYIEELEKKAEAGEKLLENIENCNHKYQGEDWQNGKNFDEQVTAALDIYRNAIK